VRLYAGGKKVAGFPDEKLMERILENDCCHDQWGKRGIKLERASDSTSRTKDVGGAKKVCKKREVDRIVGAKHTLNLNGKKKRVG